MKSDVEIAQAASLKPIGQIAADLGLDESEYAPYGHDKAKISLSVLERLKDRPNGKLILCTAINPTAAGEGKTTTNVGLSMALNRVGKKTMTTLREPSLGPCFGMKGGAAGGGYAQVVPMDDINLHFTGDFHAITSAHNLLAALLDNSIHQGNPLGIDPKRITWPRVLDMNDRALRNIVIGMGKKGDGVVRQAGFEITVASEIMAALCLATGIEDLKERFGRIIVGYTYDKQPVTAAQLDAPGAMALLMKDAVNPNLVQTLENTPAIIHGGPFANIAHGNNSVVATQTALKLADYVVTEAGFGADLGAEKFFDIVCPAGGLEPSAVVVVATVRALKLNGGQDKKELATENVEALGAGLVNLEQHLENIAKFGVPAVVAINRFPSDTDAELDLIRERCASWVPCPARQPFSGAAFPRAAPACPRQSRPVGLGHTLARQTGVGAGQSVTPPLLALGAHPVGLQPAHVHRRTSLRRPVHRQHALAGQERLRHDVGGEQCRGAQTAVMVELRKRGRQGDPASQTDGGVQRRGDDGRETARLDDLEGPRHTTQGGRLDHHDVGGTLARHAERVLGPADGLVGGDGHVHAGPGQLHAQGSQLLDRGAGLFGVLQVQPAQGGQRSQRLLDRPGSVGVDADPRGRPQHAPDLGDPGDVVVERLAPLRDLHLGGAARVEGGEDSLDLSGGQSGDGGVDPHLGADRAGHISPAELHRGEQPARGVGVLILRKRCPLGPAPRTVQQHPLALGDAPEAHPHRQRHGVGGGQELSDVGQHAARVERPGADPAHRRSARANDTWPECALGRDADPSCPRTGAQHARAGSASGRLGPWHSSGTRSSSTARTPRPRRAGGRRPWTGRSSSTPRTRPSRSPRG